MEYKINIKKNGKLITFAIVATLFFMVAVSIFCIQFVGQTSANAMQEEEQSIVATVNQSGEFLYQILPDNTVEIIASFHTSASVTIPATINGRQVTRIGDSAFRNRFNLQTLTFPESIESIGADVFFAAINLRTVISLRPGPPETDWRTFNGMSSNVRLYVPYGSWEWYMRDSNWRQSFNFNIIEMPPPVLFNYRILYDNTVEILSSFDTSASVTIPATINGRQVTRIGDNAFRNRTTLNMLTFPATIRSIGAYVFFGATNLRTVVSLRPGPPETDWRTFEGMSSNVTLFVPRGSWEWYMRDSNWRQSFNFNIVEL
ncbi:MAG: leucine-rich repeat domain-containing protein [Firmicutes bacterium]|nr:leucine-rich repeat domain-containing protein [Bacillota bacterium]